MLQVILLQLAAALQALPYDQACEECQRARRPMVVGIGCAAPEGEWVLTRASRLEGFRAPCVVVAVPGADGWPEWRATLGPGATVEDVRRVLAPPARKYDPYRAAVRSGAATVC